MSGPGVITLRPWRHDAMSRSRDALPLFSPILYSAGFTERVRQVPAPAIFGTTMQVAMGVTCETKT